MKSSLMLGVNPNTERHKEDFYATNPKALEIFLDKLKQDNISLAPYVWECAVGMGHLAKVLTNHGYIVKSSDIVDRGYQGTIISDFLQETNSWSGDILTNPPFKLAEKFVEKGMNMLFYGDKLLLFLKIQFLEGQRRKELFKEFPIKYVYCYSARQQCCRDAKFEEFTATTQFYAWYIWEKGFVGETIVRWI